MVLQILADAFQGMDDRHAGIAQPVGIADTGKLQNVGRLHGAAAEQHLGLGTGLTRLAAL